MDNKKSPRSNHERMEMWNSIEGLSKLFYASQWAMAVLGVLTAGAIVFSIVVSARKDKLVGAEENRKTDLTRQRDKDQADQISNLKTQLATATQTLDDLRSQRSLTREQAAEMSAFLKKQPRQELLILRVDDFETQTFAEQISKVFSGAGWTVPVPMFRIITHAEPGLMILVQDIRNAPVGAGVLQQAFKAAHIDVPGASSGSVESGKFILWIGPKKIGTAN